MTIELWMLLCATLLVASLWIPYIVGVNLHLPATQEPGLRPPDTRLLPDWVQRANRAHINLVEQFVPFAAVVLIAHLSGVATPVTSIASVAFVMLRVAHAVGYITAWTQIPMRPILFTAAWVSILAIAVEIVRIGLS